MPKIPLPQRNLLPAACEKGGITHGPALRQRFPATVDCPDRPVQRGGGPHRSPDGGERTGLSVSALIRHALLNVPPPRRRRRPAVDQVAMAKLLGEMGKVGSNINQLAHYAHRGTLSEQQPRRGLTRPHGTPARLPAGAGARPSILAGNVSGGGMNGPRDVE